MSKKLVKTVHGPQIKLEVGEVANLPWYNLHAFQERNTRKDTFGRPLADLAEVVKVLGEGEERKVSSGGDDQPLVAVLFDGWDSVKGSVEATIPTKDEIALAITQRREQLAKWRQFDDEHSRLADFVEAYWFPNGKPCEILAIANMSYRRTFALPAVVYARSRRGVDKSGNYTVPVVVCKYANELSAFLRHVLENDKDSGRKKYSDRDWLLIAKRLRGLDDKATESSLLRLGAKRGTAQKVWRFVLLDERFSDRNLYERAMSTPTDLDDSGQYPHVEPDPKGLTEKERIGSYIPLDKMDKEDIGALLNDIDPAKRTEKVPKVATTKIVEGYVEHKVRGGKSVTTWNRKDSENLMGSKVMALRLLGWAEKAARRDVITALEVQYGDKLNEVFKLEDMEALKLREKTE